MITINNTTRRPTARFHCGHLSSVVDRRSRGSKIPFSRITVSPALGTIPYHNTPFRGRGRACRSGHSCTIWPLKPDAFALAREMVARCSRAYGSWYIPEDGCWCLTSFRGWGQQVEHGLCPCLYLATKLAQQIHWCGPKMNPHRRHNKGLQLPTERWMFRKSVASGREPPRQPR